MKTLSTTDAARILHVTRERVRQLCDERKLKAEKMGRDWRILPRAVEDYQHQRLIDKRFGHDPDRHKFANEHPEDVTF